MTTSHDSTAVPPGQPPTRRGGRGWWAALCLAVAIGLAAVIITRFGWQVWTAIVIGVLLLCPLVLVWGMVESLRTAPLVVGPFPETRGILIDWLAPVYDPMCTIVGAGMAMRRRTVALAGLRSGDRVLDVGCGTGVLTRLAAETVGPQGAVIGIDPGPAMIGIARLERARSHSRARFEPGVIESLDFADGSFDAVLCSFVLHHLPAELKRAGLREVRRVLKPGGRFLLVDFDTARPLARAVFALFRLMPGSDVLRAAGDPVPLLRDAGFEEVAVAGNWRATATFWMGRKPCA
jgi:ubiquinone/menaquinone biosynthesis C-methylase UbiE